MRGKDIDQKKDVRNWDEREKTNKGIVRDSKRREGFTIGDKEWRKTRRDGSRKEREEKIWLYLRPRWENLGKAYCIY